VFGDVELRFPLIEAMRTPIGVLGGVRGVAFFNIGAGWYTGQNFTFSTSATETYQRQTDVYEDPNGGLVGVYDPPVTVSGFRLRDARASYGIGVQTFLLGLPMHFDWAWRTTFNKAWEDAYFGTTGPTSATVWRKPRFQFWIGFDF
jgi:outer membrane protein assembly factor BamA